MEGNTQILIISDNVNVQALYQEYIAKTCIQSIELIIKFNIKEAIEFLTGTNKVKCILLDKTKSNKISSSITKDFINENKTLYPIILLVDKGYEENPFEGVKSGVMHYLVTPVSSIEEFHSVISSAIENDEHNNPFAQFYLGQNKNIDPLTGLPNKFFFEFILLRSLSKAKRYGLQFATFVINLSEFKNINEVITPEKGDLLLKQIVERLQSGLRAEDMVARIEGDKFAIISENIKGSNDADLITSRLNSAFDEPFFLEEYEITIGLDIAVSIYPVHGGTIVELMKNAYQELRTFKDNVLLASPCKAKKINKSPPELTQ